MRHRNEARTASAGHAAARASRGRCSVRGRSRGQLGEAGGPDDSGWHADRWLGSSPPAGSAGKQLRRARRPGIPGRGGRSPPLAASLPGKAEAHRDDHHPGRHRRRSRRFDPHPVAQSGRSGGIIERHAAAMGAVAGSLARDERTAPSPDTDQDRARGRVGQRRPGRGAVHAQPAGTDPRRQRRRSVHRQRRRPPVSREAIVTIRDVETTNFSKDRVESLIKLSLRRSVHGCCVMTGVFRR